MIKRGFLVGMILLLSAWLLAGCGVAQEQYDAVVAERDSIQAQFQSASSELSTVQAELQSASSELDAVQAELEQAQAEVESAQAKNSEMTSNLEKAEAELEAVQARLLEAKAEHEAFKLNLNDIWNSLLNKLFVLARITNYWNNAAWVTVGEMSEEEYTHVVGLFMANTGTYVDAVGNSELKQYWEDFFIYAAQENELEATVSLAKLTDLLLWEVLGEDIGAIEAVLTGGGEMAAAETELRTIQTAVIAVMVDNELSTLPNPVTVATNDMGAFPDLSICGIDKLYDPHGNLYVTGSDKDGYLLIGHDITGDADKHNILVDYVASRYTVGTYMVDAYGTVTQVTTGYE